MKNWEYKKLSDVANFRNGVAHEKEIEKEGQFIVVNSKFVSSNGESKKYTNEFLSPLHKDEVVFVMSDVPKGKTLAKCFIIDNENLYSLNQRICAFSNIKTDLRFFYYYINRNKYFLSFDNGENQTNLRKNDILNCPFPLPPLEEQKRIVKILDEKFAMLETVKANAKANLQNAKDLFQSQLTKTFSNTTWEKKRLDSIADIKSGFAFKGSAFKTEGEYQVLRLGNVKQNYLRVEEKAVFVSGISESDFSKAKVNVGDLVITQTGTKGKRDYGFVAIVDRENLLLNQRLAAITTNENLYNRYLLYYSYTENFKDQFFANEGGTVGQGNIGLTDIKEIEIPLPPLPEQKRIVEQLDSLSEKVRSLEEIYTKQLANCDELKQAFLAKAFAGEL